MVRYLKATSKMMFQSKGNRTTSNSTIATIHEDQELSKKTILEHKRKINNLGMFRYIFSLSDYLKTTCSNTMKCQLKVITEENLLELVQPAKAKPVLTTTNGRRRFGGPKYG